MGKEASRGHICSSAYFQPIDSEVNKKFVNAFKERFGELPINREMAASYDAVHTLASAFSRFKRSIIHLLLAKKGLYFSQSIKSRITNLGWFLSEGTIYLPKWYPPSVCNI